MERKLHIWSWILIGALLLPLFQHLTNIPNKRNLKGAVVVAAVPEFSSHDWFEGEYQPKAEKALNDRMGYRRTFVKINNQVSFSLYNKIYAGGVVLGKENYMYETNYIKAYYGTDFIGDAVIRDKVRKLKLIQDSLSARGTTLLLAFAAGKGSYYPEYFPDKYHTEKGPTNIETFVELCKEEGVNHIDFNSWFLSMKDTTQYCLYPRTGIHWSYYGMVLAIDSLISKTENLTGMVMPAFEWDKPVLSRKYRSSDKDIEEGLNLIFRVNRDKLAYPKVHYPEGKADTVKSIVIADSFYWGLYNLGLSNRAFHDGEFWYYYKRIYANHIDKEVPLDEVDRMAKIEECDIVILMATEATLPDFPWGFEEEKVGCMIDD